MKKEIIDIVIMFGCIGLLSWTNNNKKNAGMLLLVIAIVAVAHFTGICGRLA